jgi:hypothetical protein
VANKEVKIKISIIKHLSRVYPANKDINQRSIIYYMREADRPNKKRAV